MTFDFQLIAVGAGPGGISLAIECIELGMKADRILILEKAPVPIDAIRKFYPDKKMTIANYKNLPADTIGHLSKFPDLTKEETLKYFDDLIQKYSLKIKYNSEVTKIQKAEKGLHVFFGHESVTVPFVGIGIGILGRPNKPDYKIPSSVKDRILYDMTTKPVKNEKVMVVGGGDTSSEYCQALIQDGNDVTLCYRGVSFSRMLEQNSKAVETLQSEDKIKVLLNTNIKEIADDIGRPQIIFADASMASLTFDKIIFAIGGTTPTNFLKSSGIEFEKDWPRLNEVSETNISGLYLLGDLVAGKQGGSIITAYNAAFKTAKDITSKIHV